MSLDFSVSLLGFVGLLLGLVVLFVVVYEVDWSERVLAGKPKPVMIRPQHKTFFSIGLIYSL